MDCLTALPVEASPHAQRVPEIAERSEIPVNPCLQHRSDVIPCSQVTARWSNIPCIDPHRNTMEFPWSDGWKPLYKAPDTLDVYSQVQPGTGWPRTSAQNTESLSEPRSSGVIRK